ncbi:hypothetical protein ACSSZE_18555 [Acidithiobacillus caldus]
MHLPEQRITDYKAQKAGREAPVLTLLSTVAVVVILSIAAATIAFRAIIGQFVQNFFPVIRLQLLRLMAFECNSEGEDATTYLQK